MGKMGRPRHPDILTPREWEVLALLREHLTNEQIAARLGITLDGAKYHVSQILSKLGVATREEAAAWRQEERRPRIRWRVLVPIAGTALLVATAAGLTLLAWGVIQTEKGSDPSVATNFNQDLDGQIERECANGATVELDAVELDFNLVRSISQLVAESDEIVIAKATFNGRSVGPVGSGLSAVRNLYMLDVERFLKGSGGGRVDLQTSIAYMRAEPPVLSCLDVPSPISEDTRYLFFLREDGLKFVPAGEPFRFRIENGSARPELAAGFHTLNLTDVYLPWTEQDLMNAVVAAIQGTN